MYKSRVSELNHAKPYAGHLLQTRNVDIMLTLRLRRWPTLKWKSGKLFVSSESSAGTSCKFDHAVPLPTQQKRDGYPVLIRYWASVVDDGPTLIQHWINVFVGYILSRSQGRLCICWWQWQSGPVNVNSCHVHTTVLWRPHKHKLAYTGLTSGQYSPRSYWRIVLVRSAIGLHYERPWLQLTLIISVWSYYQCLLCLPSVRRGGDMLAYLCPLSVSVAFCESVCPVHFCPSLPIVQVVKHETLTQWWANAGHGLWRWANISPVLGYPVMFGAKLNVGQRHRRLANINPALVQSIVPVPSAWSTDQTFNRHWVGVGV